MDPGAWARAGVRLDRHVRVGHRILFAVEDGRPGGVSRPARMALVCALDCRSDAAVVDADRRMALAYPDAAFGGAGVGGLPGVLPDRLAASARGTNGRRTAQTRALDVRRRGLYVRVPGDTGCEPGSNAMDRDAG